MTREEAIKYLIKPVATSTKIGEEKQKEFEAYNMAIQALEEPSYNSVKSELDAIIRQAVLDLIADYDLSMGQVVKGIHALPPVKPQEPKWARLYSWLNDMRLGIAPDETVTDIDERNERIAQTDIIDEIMEWMLKQEPQESEVVE